MSKDPAFLFYSKDFYEGTRMMLPEERACYIDLMIYQHQNGIIPKDLRRVLMYCSGIDEATLKATLEAKFKLCNEGWYNEKLLSLTEERKEYSSKQSDNGRVGQFFKHAKSELSAKEYKELKDFVYQDFGKDQLLNIIKKSKTLKATLKAILKHLEDGNGDAIANEDEDTNENKKGGSGEKSKTPKNEKIDFDKITKIFNETCLELPDVQKLTDKRKTAVKARVKEYQPEDVEIFFQTVFGKVSENKFLNGDNDRGWKADFDWILNPNNLIKILEGNYNGKAKQTSKTRYEPSDSLKRRIAEKMGS